MACIGLDPATITELCRDNHKDYLGQAQARVRTEEFLKQIIMRMIFLIYSFC